MPPQSDSHPQNLLIEIRTEELPPAQLWELADSFPDTLLAALQKEGFADSESLRAQNENGDNKKLATPRRLAAQLSNIRGALSPQEIVRRGPQISACKDSDGTPTKALIGFMQSVGATCEKELTTVTEKGKEHIAWRGKTATRKLADELAAVVERVLFSLPAPRLMRWGANEFKFIRPVRGILMLHGKQHISGNLMGIAATKTTKGHPYMSKGDVKIADVDSYVDTLERYKVIVDINDRLHFIKKEVCNGANWLSGSNIIEREKDEESFDDENSPVLDYEIEGVCATLYGDEEKLVTHIKQELQESSEFVKEEFFLLRNERECEDVYYYLRRSYPEYAIDEVFTPILFDENAVLRETSAMCEWPVVLGGRVAQEFQSLPQVCIAECLQKHQRFLPLVVAKYNALIICSDMDSDSNSCSASDFDLREITISSEYWLVADNEAYAYRTEIKNRYDMVLRARLSDVLFYYEEDKKIPLSVYVKKLKRIVYHQKLGSQHDRIERVCKIAENLGEKETVKFRENAEKYLAPLPTQMVGEYPKLREEMSKCYFGYNSKGFVDACYWLEKLVGIFGVGEVPTSSKDPHGLKRDATDLAHYLNWSHFPDAREAINAAIKSFDGKIGDVSEEVYNFILDRLDFLLSSDYEGNLMPFKCSQHARKAVLSYKPKSFKEAVHQIVALDNFEHECGERCAVLSAANKRINNIFRKSKADSANFPPINSDLFSENAEQALCDQLDKVRLKINQNSQSHPNYPLILQEIATLAPFVDTFFDNVLVNHEDEKIRNNRFALLAQLRELLNTVGDLSYLAK